MSAFICEDKTINKIIFELNKRDNEWNRQQFRHLGFIGEFGQTFGQAMFNLNCKSVDARYSEENSTQGYKFRFEPCNSIQAYKALKCFLYQSCEGLCDQDPLYLELEKFATSVANDIINGMDSYQSATWG